MNIHPTQLPVNHPLVVEALTGINKRALELVRGISDRHAAMSPDTELVVANLIASHVTAVEWPAAATFYHEASNA